MSAEKLMIGVPSKGRLQENTHAFFKRAGLELVRERGERDYRGGLKGFDAVEVQYLSASDIAGELARGGLHLGVTGEDLIRESIADADALITLLTPLGFGQANVVVAVPQAWIDVRSMADIEDVAADFHARKGSRMRVATKYLSLTRRHFAAHGVGDYRIVESLGATEGAPASGAAELIVDITTTGATLAANGLKIVDDGVILKSEANLVAARTADWSDAAKAAAKAILARIAAEETARTTREVKALMGGDRAALARDAAEQFGALVPFGGGAQFVSLHCAADKAVALADWLIAEGASQVTVQTLDYIFTAKNALYEKLEASLTSASMGAALP